MIRLLADGILVGWDVWALWLLLPVPGTIVGMLLWYLARWLLDRHMPEARRVREARAADRQTIATLKARLWDSDEARRVAEAHVNELHIRRVAG